MSVVRPLQVVHFPALMCSFNFKIVDKIEGSWPFKKSVALEYTGREEILRRSQMQMEISHEPPVRFLCSD